MTRRKKARTFRVGLRGQLFILILVTGALCLGLFRFLWLHKWAVWAFYLDELPVAFHIFPEPDENFWDQLYDEALKYDIPESEDDLDAVKALSPLFDLADDFTSLYIYGLDGLYRAGQIPRCMDNLGYAGFFSLGYRLTNGVGEQPFEFVLEFKNGYANVTVIFYHSANFMFPYLILCFVVCVLFFFVIILFFVGRKMKAVGRLEQDILRMAAGDLITPVAGSGRDELGVLSQELDQLRGALYDNLAQQQEIHRSNQELIAALSHDLRTPLTILSGYLEIMQQNRNPALQSEYLSRCQQKTLDIQEMTDRMFEYALVFDESEPVTLTNIPLLWFLDELREHADFLRLSGFHAVPCLPEDNRVTTAEFLGDRALVKRICSNLFSNILKYGDKREPVTLTATVDKDILITLENTEHPAHNGVESNKIGLKSVHKMLELMNGTLTVSTEAHKFTVQLRIPLQTEY